jgi:hypothetical protein
MLDYFFINLMIYILFTPSIQIREILNRIFDPKDIFSVFPTSSFLSNIKLFKNLEFLRQQAFLALGEEEDSEWSVVLQIIKNQGATVFASKIEDLLQNGYAGEFTQICGQAFKKTAPCVLFGFTLEELLKQNNILSR